MVDSKNNYNVIHYEKIQTNGWKQQILQSLYQNGYIPISIQFMHKLGCLNKILTIFELSNVVNAYCKGEKRNKRILYYLKALTSSYLNFR